MSALAQRKEQARLLAEKEKRDLMLKKAAEAGLLHEETELPPEEMDQKDVGKSIAYSILSMIPYTSAWYESRAAETEMDDLEKIRIERAKAEDLLAMTKMGRHEEALKIMRAETDRDFFFFNKLRHQQESEGKVDVKAPPPDPFDKFKKGVTRNRIHKANGASFALMATTTMKLPTTSENNTGTGRRVPLDTPCSWRGKSPQGEYLQCSNLRMQDKSKPYDDNGKEMFELFAVCAFHLKECVGEVHREHNEKVVIQQPNDEALCTECYFQKKKRKAPVLKANSLPGVGPAVAKGPPRSTETEDDEELKDEEAGRAGPSIDLSTLNEKSRCRWIPNSKDNTEREYECHNTIILHPTTKVFVPYCMYHVKVCLLSHSAGDSAAVTIPNEHGLCNMHFTAKFGKPPQPLTFPLPGMKKKIAKNAWRIQVGHWAAPTWAPEQSRVAAAYEEPEPPDGYREAMVANAKYLFFLRRKRKFGKAAALKIQTAFRRYRVRNQHLELLFHKRLRKRVHSTIVIQAQMRRFLAKKHVNERRLSRNKAAEHIQSRYRGYKYRWHKKRIWAANRIKKLFKKLSFFKFKDTIIMIMQLKTMYRKRIQKLVRIQKVWRGYQGRMYVFRVRLHRLLIRRSAKIVTRFIRAYAHYIYTMSLVVTDDEILYLQAKHLARVVTNTYIDLIDRRNQFILENASAVSCQRLIRGYLARSGTNRLRDLREIMRKWCEPQYANEFLNRFLVNKFFDAMDNPPKPPTPPQPVVEFLRPYLGDQRHRALLDVAPFTEALERWYIDNKLLLLDSEKDSILRRFKMPGTNKLNLADFETYAKMHTLPCRKHGRRICGDCIFYRECTRDKCSCTAMRHGSDAAICKTCNHASAVHRTCPLQLKPSKDQQSLLGILNARRDPDMSIPNNVAGISLTEALIPPPDEAKQRIEYNENLVKTQKQTLADFWQNLSLQKELSHLLVSGDTIAERDDYWDQPSAFDVITANVETSALTMDVATWNMTPNYDISPEQFWDSAAKNPNKTMRDYDEKFEHNMPLPIVHNGELHFTFEGPKIYLNIVLQLLKMEDKVHDDDPEFLRLIMNYIQVFERHWRKMVADIRVGILNRHLNVPQDIKKIFESINYPRPELAKKLDTTFRNLGFHKKVLGKDIKVQKYAERRFKKWVDPKARRLSLPSRQLANPPPLSDLTGPLSRANTAAAESMEKLMSSPWGRSTETPKSPLRRNRAATPPLMLPANAMSDTRSLSPLQQISPSKRLSTPLNGERLGSAGTRTKPMTPAQKLGQVSAAMKSGAIEELREREHEFATRGPSRRSRSDGRRGSDTDVLRPTTAAEVNAMNNAIESAPRDDYRHIVRTEEMRFICPFPACGLCFTSMESAFLHLPSHEKHNRLQVATPFSDSHQRYFWPKDVPWIHNSRYKDVAIPPGSHPCPIENCNEVCPSQERLKTHIRLVHAKLDASSLHRKYFQCGGECISVPPYEPPFDARIRWCPNHLIPARKCALCLELENITTQPQPPFKFYLGPITINFKIRHESVKQFDFYAKSNHSDDSDDYQILINDPESAVILREVRYFSGANIAGDFKALPIGFLIDKSNKGWLAVKRLMACAEIEARRGSVPSNFDRAFELMPANDVDSVGTSMWVPMVSVVGFARVLRIGKDEFRAKRKSKEIPSKNVFFMSPEA